MYNFNLEHLIQKHKPFLLDNPDLKSVKEFEKAIAEIKEFKQEESLQIKDCFLLLMYIDKSSAIKSYYHLYWNYKKAFYIAKTSNIQSRKVTLKELYFDSNKTDSKKMEAYRRLPECKEPIIVARFVPTNELIVIDGNHRCTNAFEKGRELIEAYILEPYQFRQAFNSELDLQLYNFHLKYLELISDQNKMPLITSNQNFIIRTLKKWIGK